MFSHAVDSYRRFSGLLVCTCHEALAISIATTPLAPSLRARPWKSSPLIRWSQVRVASIGSVGGTRCFLRCPIPVRLAISPGAKLDRRRRPERVHARDGGHQNPGLTFLRCAFLLRLEDRGRASLLRPFTGRIPALRTPCFAWAPAQALRGLGVRRDERPPDTRLYPVHPLDPSQVSGSPMASPFSGMNVHRTLILFCLTPVPLLLRGPPSGSNGERRAARRVLLRRFENRVR